MTWLEGCDSDLRSPNAHKRIQPFLATVLHYTASAPGARGDVAWLCDPRAKASAHFVVDRGGKIWQLVSLDECAWHAGASVLRLPSGASKRGCNDFTIGIEIDSWGFLQRSENGAFFAEEGNALVPYRGPEPVEAFMSWDGGPSIAGFWEPYTEAQIAATFALLKKLEAAGFGEAANFCVGHDEIALPAGRKRDPGPLFPWHRFPRRTSRLVQTSHAFDDA